MQKRSLKKNTAAINPAESVSAQGRINFLLRQNAVPKKIQAITAQAAPYAVLTPVSKQLKKQITVPEAPAAATIVLSGDRLPVLERFSFVQRNASAVIPAANVQTSFAYRVKFAGISSRPEFPIK